MVSSRAATVEEYLRALPSARRVEIERVRDIVNDALPDGYVEAMAWRMIGWSIPLERYPDTYNGQPLAYAALAAQKNHNSLYLNGLYASEEKVAPFAAAFAAAGKALEMGKSCLRFRKADDLALEVIRSEIASTSPEEFIRIYEQSRSSGRS